jgi:hypothetical protein
MEKKEESHLVGDRNNAIWPRSDDREERVTQVYQKKLPFLYLWPTDSLALSIL